MPSEIKTCPICSNNQLEQCLSVKDYSISKELFNISLCKTCGFRFTNPRPNENEIGNYYQSQNYISHSDTKKGLINRLYHLVRKKSLNEKLNLVNKLVQHKKGNLLDIGAGTGYFLKRCLDHGWNVDGMEPDSKARAIAESNTGKNLFSNLFDIPKKEQYKVISLWHVLEHIHQLNESIEYIYQLLELNGKLIIAVPNINSYDSTIYKEYWAALDVPRHLYHFSQKNIIQLMALHKLVHINTLPMKFDSFYVCMLSDKYKYGRTNYIRAFWNGLISNFKATKNKEYSSLIYVFEKNG